MKKKKLIKLMIVIILIVIIISISFSKTNYLNTLSLRTEITEIDLSKGDNNSNASAISVVGKDIYVIGHKRGHNVYWKNGKENIMNGYLKMFTTENNFFLLEYKNNKNKTEIKCWKNGKLFKEYNLSENNSISRDSSYAENYINSIYIKEDNIYAAGYEYSGYENTKHMYAKCWKNDTDILLKDKGFGTGESVAEDITIVGYNIFTTGWRQKDSFINDALLWKNTDGKLLNSLSINARAKSICVVENDIYVAGYEEDINTGNHIAKYWKNGIAINLSDGKYEAEANSIIKVEKNIYIVGYEINGKHKVAKYWKNGKSINITDGKKDVEATSICVSGDNIYISGIEKDGFNSSYAKYWKIH